jgi:hypothetical protein
MRRAKYLSILIIIGTWLFQDFLRPPRWGFGCIVHQRSIYRWKALAEQFLVLVQAIPSRFVLRLPWDSERSAGFDYTSLKPKNVRCSHIRRIGRLTNRLDAFAAIKSLLMRRRQSLFPHKPALGRRYGSFRLENWLGHSLSLFDRSCIGGFAARPSIWWSFSSFWCFSS